MRIAAGSVILDGSIQADGGSGTYYSGGGSGGGVRIDADTLTGSGHIYARGGANTNANRYGGAGGGGRIAIYYQTMSLPVGNIVANGGKSGDGSNSGRNGGAGTIYLKAAARQYGISSSTTPASGPPAPQRCRAPPMRV